MQKEFKVEDIKSIKMAVLYGKKDCPDTTKAKECFAKLNWPIDYRGVDEQQKFEEERISLSKILNYERIPMIFKKKMNVFQFIGGYEELEIQKKEKKLIGLK